MNKILEEVTIVENSSGEGRIAFNKKERDSAIKWAIRTSKVYDKHLRRMIAVPYTEYITRNKNLQIKVLEDKETNLKECILKAEDIEVKTLISKASIEALERKGKIKNNKSKKEVYLINNNNTIEAHI